MTDESWNDDGKRPSDNEVAFDYIKSNDFRTLWADGFMASATPNGMLHFGVYSERPAFPRRTVFKIDTENDCLGDEVLEKRISRGSIVRELSCDVVLSREAAENLVELLKDCLAQMDSRDDDDDVCAE